MDRIPPFSALCAVLCPHLSFLITEPSSWGSRVAGSLPRLEWLPQSPWEPRVQSHTQCVVTHVYKSSACLALFTKEGMSCSASRDRWLRPMFWKKMEGWRAGGRALLAEQLPAQTEVRSNHMQSLVCDYLELQKQCFHSLKLAPLPQ